MSSLTYAALSDTFNLLVDKSVDKGFKTIRVFIENASSLITY